MKFHRRIFLRGLGGAAVAAPFLGSLVERAARAQGMTGGAAPRRLIVMFTNNGSITTRWFPENSHGALTADDYVGTSLEVMAPHAAKLLVPRGIRAMNEWTVDASLGQGNDYHTQVCGTYFTCVPVTPHSGDPFDFREEVKFNAMPTPPREFANAPINEYYCNLMNAIGVKAGTDGFPAVGGTEEVTHYGMYDRTEDFASGGELEPTIHDPGGFEALRANS